MWRALLLPFLLLGTPICADTYLRQPEADVVHYSIRIELSDTSDSILGAAKVVFRIRRDGTSRLWLDFDAMSADSAGVNGKSAGFTQQNGKLDIALGRPFSAGETVEVEVRYHGTSGKSGLVVGRNRHGRRVFFAENWPNHAHEWFPCVDHPSDKATVEFHITTPDKYEVVGNGRLVESVSLLDGRKLTRWKESVPIPTYCMVIGVAEFSITSPEGGRGVPLFFYAFPQDSAAAGVKFERTRKMLEVFADLIGPYPYEKLAQVQSATQIGGMENASAIFYAEGLFRRGKADEAPVPHEVAHQWFGDSVTAADWDHIWLSEGFATYFNALFYEKVEGPERFTRIMAEAAGSIMKSPAGKISPLVDPAVTDPMSKLNVLSYEKGAWVLHMLRGMLGDEGFFRGIRRYYSLHRDSGALTEDFQRVMEAASGTSLGGFFRQWCYRPGWPEFELTWRWNERAREVEVSISQRQAGEPFDVFSTLVAATSTGPVSQRVRISGRTTVLRIPLASKPSGVELDPGGWLLKSVRYN